MTVKIGNLEFDNATYDGVGDVLYLHIGERRAAADSEQTPEGHVLRFDSEGRVIGDHQCKMATRARWRDRSDAARAGSREVRSA